MSDRLCPCGARLDRSSTVRSLGSPFFHLFMSIRTMKSVSSTTKVCQSCRHLYNKWRKENPEFSNVLGYMESGDSESEDSDTNSVRDGFHQSILRHRQSFSRLIRWIHSLLVVRAEQQWTIQWLRRCRPAKQSSCRWILLDHLTSKQNTIVFWDRLELHSSKCCVCRAHLAEGSAVVSSDDRDVVFFTRNIWIPEGARCCPHHIVHRRLTKQALDLVKPLSIRYEEWNSGQIEVLLQKFRNLYNGRKRFNFDDPWDLSDDTCSALTSLSRDEFDQLVETVSSCSDARNSSQRSIGTAIGIYLCKLRLGLSNRLLLIMFDLPDKRAVSRIINSARQALKVYFTPRNLGFGHVTRQCIIDRHTTTISRQLMCDGGNDTAILVVDGTYIYIQVRRCVYTCSQSILSFFRSPRRMHFNESHSILTRSDLC